MWYFELFDMVHKLLVASIVSLFAPTVQVCCMLHGMCVYVACMLRICVNMSLKVPVAMGILGAYQCFLVLTQPYVRKADNQLHLTSQVIAN